MSKVFLLFFTISTILLFTNCHEKKTEFSGNPLFEEPLTADPAVLVYKDTLYLFTGSDEVPVGEDGFVMKKWYVFSTADMVNWTNHGVKLSVEDFDWASKNAFAGHCVENHGKFWWYVPMVVKDTTTILHEGFGIGVAVADHPLGPYKDASGQPIICDTTANSIVLNIDPAVYVDDDGQVYMYWGSWNAARYVKLKDNMIETDGPVETVKATNFFEAPWIHKKDDTYYLSYAAHYPSTTEYSTSKSITGPWEYQGVINDTIPNSPTNHQAIVTFKGQDYIFYHNADTPTGGPFRRSVCVDKLEYDENGKIVKLVRTKTGVPAIE
ncbi:glycoside hydrolase family 43 protein [Maribellus sediminis]|uniref:glycoside hydrolase family 43 protein n=1 Tax=Maribellus sediminis TaxID=2696285 RepID=UPI001431F7DD|nr:glycoside hydrolase family 43 protein [Maribellus sediminis]